MVRTLAGPFVDFLPRLPDAVEGFEDRCDVILPELAAVGEQDELGSRRALFHLVAQRQQGAHGARNHPERCLHLAARLLDAPADLLLLFGLEQLAAAHVFQVDAYEIEIFPSRSRLRRLFPFFFFVVIPFDLGAQRFVAFVHHLVVEGLGVVLFDQLPCREHDRFVGLVGGNDPEFVRPLPPVEHVGVLIGLRPVDQGIRVVAGAAAPPGSRRRGPVSGNRSGSHNSRVLQVGCLWNVICSRPIGGRQLLP